MDMEEAVYNSFLRSCSKIKYLSPASAKKIAGTSSKTIPY